jgi:microcystin-dependent protein
MSAPFVAEIRVFAFNFAPTGWASCDGQLLPISQNTALFSLLGTFYGGDGKSNFALPNLNSSLAMSQGQGQGLSDRFLGESGGTPSVTLLESEMPFHTHSLSVSTSQALERQPVNQRPAAGDGVGLYDDRFQPTTSMAVAALTFTGGSLPHENRMPSLGLQFCIALQGVFPPRQ